MNRLTVEHNPTVQETLASKAQCRETALRRILPRSKACPLREVLITPSIASQSRAAVFRNDIKHWLDICRRTGDYTQNLARGCLLLQRFFELLEQPDILNGDHGLIGESFEELDLRRRKGPQLVRRAASNPISSPC